jgi:hypothetical protein
METLIRFAYKNVDVIDFCGYNSWDWVIEKLDIISLNCYVLLISPGYHVEI